MCICTVNANCPSGLTQYKTIDITACDEVSGPSLSVFAYWR